MKKDKKQIMRMFLQGEFSRKGEEAVQKWIVTNRDQEEKEEASREYWEHLFVLPDSRTPEVWERVKQKAGIRSGERRRDRWWQQIAVVLIPLVLFAGGSFWYYQKQVPFWMEITVAYGEQQHLVLNDGSSVYLNAGSKFRYPKKFTTKERRVYLSGEAFFAVESNPDSPFFIESEKQLVKVTGTSFNIKAYPEDDRIITTLYSGKVDVYPDGRTAYSLEPDQQLTYDKMSRESTVRQVPDHGSNDWINGSLIFMDVTMEEIRRVLERRFNVQFMQEPGIHTTNERYTVRFVRNDSLESILTVLQTITGNLRYEVNEEIVYVKEIIR